MDSDKKFILKIFDKNRFTLRPSSLNKIINFLKDRQEQKSKENQEFSPQHYLDLIIEKIKQNMTGSNIIEDNMVQQAFDFIMLPEQQLQQNDHSMILDTKQQKQMSEIDRLLQLRLENSILILDNYNEVPVLKGDYDGLTVIQNSQKLQKKQEQKYNSFLANPEDKIELLRDRFKLMKMKIEECTKYKFSIPQKITTDQDIVLLSEIGALRGSKNREMHTFGIIKESGLQEGEYNMQDLYSSVKVDISNSVIKKGYVTNSCMVIARGKYSDLYGKFIIDEIILPEFQNRTIIKKHFQNNGDLFGAQNKMHNILGNILKLELENKESKYTRFERERQIALGFIDFGNDINFQNQRKEDLAVIVISDFNMSNSKVLEKFDELLNGVQNYMKPVAFIIMGMFFDINEIYDEDDYIQTQGDVENFVNIMKKYPDIKNKCYFIFIPNVSDFGTQVIPRQEISEHLFTEIEKNIPFCIRAQNPCRISIFGKEIVIYRNDFLVRLRKQQLVINQAEDVDNNYVHTLLSQGNLSPIQQLSSPVYWNYDHALQIFNPPHFFILADTHINQFTKNIDELRHFQPKFTKNQNSENQMEEEQLEGEEQQQDNIQQEQQQQQHQYQQNKYNNSKVLNPGSFMKHFRFSVLYPLKNKVEESEL